MRALLPLLLWLLSAVAAGSERLVVGSDQDFPPLATGTTAAEASGFTVELWREVAKEAALDYELRVRPSHELLDEFRSGKIDVLINLAQSEERRRFADFSVPHALVPGAIFTRVNDAPIDSEADLTGKSIIVLAGDLAQDYAVERGWGAQLVPVPTIAEGLRRLSGGQEDAMLVGRLAALHSIAQLGIGNLRVAEEPAGFTQKLAIAVRKGEADLLARINEALAVSKSNGSYDRLYEQWLGVLQPDSSGVFARRGLFALSVLLLLLLGYLGYRRHIESAVRVSEDRLRKVLDSSNDAYIGMDLQGRICDWNREAEATFGWSREEVIGQRLSDVVIPLTLRDAHERGLKRYLETGEGPILNRRIEIYALHRNGHEFPLELSVWPVSTEHGLTFSAFLRDVTQRKQAENDLLELTASLEERVEQRTRELAQAKELAEAASRAKSEFLAIMSHEIRTPMNGVVGMAEVLRQSPLDPDTLDAVTTIRDSALSLLQIIDDILDFSKIEAGRLELTFSECSLHELVESACYALVPYAEGLGVDLDLMIEANVPDGVRTDPDRLRRVLTNLIGNAIKFSGRRRGLRGRVEVQVQVASTEPLRLAFTVIDNGIGMSRETIERLFTPFSQAEASTTRRYGGTGLGLAICKRLLEMFKGEIAVTSTLGFGSKFRVSLPLEPVSNWASAPVPDLRGLYCIVIAGGDIEPQHLCAHLASAGAQVSIAANTASALKLALSQAQPVLIQALGRLRTPTDELLEPFARVGAARHVLIRRQQRRNLRRERENVVCVDGDAMPRRALLRAVAIAAGRSDDEAPKAATLLRRAGPPPSLAAARASGQLVLVAEDDDINQKVILRQLEILGYAAEVADDGAAALALWQRRHHWMLISDLHMPELDGYGLVAAIRAEEAGGARMPIIALTANALHGEAERAIAAGFDAFLTKPTQLDALAGVLQRWMPSTEGQDGLGATASSLPVPQAPILDVAVLKNLLGDDDADVICSFLADYRKNLAVRAQELVDALAGDDRPRVAAVAHKLKSASRSVGALALGETCAELENAGRSGDRGAIARLMEQFTPAMQAVEAELDVLLAGERSP